MTPTIINAMRAGAFGITTVMGQPITFTLADGRMLRVNAIFRPRSERISVGTDGIEMVVKAPALSIQRSSLLACGIPDRDIEAVMKGARFTAEGRDYKVEDPEDDETMFFKAWPKLIPAPTGYVSKYSR